MGGDAVSSTLATFGHPGNFRHRKGSKRYQQSFHRGSGWGKSTVTILELKGTEVGDLYQWVTQYQKLMKVMWTFLPVCQCYVLYMGQNTELRWEGWGGVEASLSVPRESVHLKRKVAAWSVRLEGTYECSMKMIMCFSSIFFCIILALKSHNQGKCGHA